MKIKLITLMFIITVTALFAQAPVVSNVRFEQRTDGSLIVDIYFDLSDDDGETKEIVVEASADNGATWTLACTSLTGDVGQGVALGTSKHAVWDFFADNPNVSGDAYFVRVNALETGTMTDYDGNVYQTVKIGTQWWMAENLKVTHYRDGFDIPHVMDQADWSKLTIGAYCNYDNDTDYVSTYGRLYTWYAATHARNLAPEGWHVPTEAEWLTMINYLGGEDAVGEKLASGSNWSVDVTNESGFTALACGIRNPIEFYELFFSSYWSSLALDSDNGKSMIISPERGILYASCGSQTKIYGYSVRLVRNN